MRPALLLDFLLSSAACRPLADVPGRGLGALRDGDGVSLSWRLLAEDPDDLSAKNLESGRGWAYLEVRRSWDCCGRGIHAR
jgi:hypothetical protein